MEGVLILMLTGIKRRARPAADVWIEINAWNPTVVADLDVRLVGSQISPQNSRI